MTRQLIVFFAMFVLGLTASCSSRPTGTGGGGFDGPVLARPDTKGRDGAPSDTKPPHAAEESPSGKIISIGDSTATNLVAHAAAEFRRVYPGVRVHATAGLAPIGLKALLEGRADIVPMSRVLTPDEITEFQKKFTYPPTQIKVAADALAIYVEKNNPLPGLTLAQLDGIFSRTPRKSGAAIERWDQVGLKDKWANRPITLYGYDPADGVSQAFRQLVLDGGEYRLLMKIELTGSAIVQDVAADPEAIGCASIFFTAKRVRTVPLSGADGQFYEPTAENVRAHTYPLRRFLYVCVNKPPKGPLTGPAADFVRFLLSREGQEIVVAGGNIPINAATADEGLQALK